MKQKMIMEFDLHCDKCRSKAMEICGVTPGILRVEILESNKNQLIITGDGVDPVNLVKKLKKKLGHVKVISVADDKGNTNDKDKDKDKDMDKGKETTQGMMIGPPPMVGYCYTPNPCYPNYPSRVVYECSPPSICSIM
ncbi:hypothetical protein ACFE04_024831 [Oxalis oulophora]